MNQHSFLVKQFRKHYTNLGTCVFRLHSLLEKHMNPHRTNLLLASKVIPLPPLELHIFLLSKKLLHLGCSLEQLQNL